VIAPLTMDALADVARALGFELRRAPLGKPIGIDYDRASEQTQFGLYRGDVIAFDGTSRECAAYLIGWRDLRAQALGALRAVDAQALPEMSGKTRCHAPDPSDPHRDSWCLSPIGHEGPHVTIHRWRGAPRKTTP
jgi:hypothetical protein